MEAKPLASGSMGESRSPIIPMIAFESVACDISVAVWLRKAGVSS